jgi:flagellar biosynthesis protein FlhF
MKIKRYTAASMRAALALVRAEQGPDAVILSSRRSDDGIEVIAAVDYDEGLFMEANRQRIPAPVAAAPAPAPPAGPAPMTAAPQRNAVRVAGAAKAAPAKIASATTVPALVPATSSRPTDLGYVAMRRELQDLRQVLETGLAGMTWNDKRLREPLKVRVLEELSAMDIAPDVALALAAFTPRRTALQDPSHIPLALLVKHLPVVDDPGGVSGGIMAIVGPTGAGKTTTIAKLAARWCMRYGSEDLALVSTDGYRIGARDQLMTYARILGAPMHAATGGRDLSRVLERLKSKKLVLIDTAGMGPRDARLQEQLAALQLGAARARVLLALPAQGEGNALDEIVRAFAPAAPAACVLTKVDEAASLGGVLSAALRHRLKIAYVCDGQRVPEDLHAAHRRRVWLVRTALALKQGRPALRDEAYYLRNFGRAGANA